MHILHTEQWCVRGGFGVKHFLQILIASYNFFYKTILSEKMSVWIEREKKKTLQISCFREEEIISLSEKVKITFTKGEYAHIAHLWRYSRRRHNGHIIMKHIIDKEPIAKNNQ